MFINIPATQNTAWGFWGAMEGRAAEAWPMAAYAISEATALSLETVRCFLDSRHGRHFADTVLSRVNNGLELDQAIDRAVEDWLGWQIGRSTSKEYGIPTGLPYLTGCVVHSELTCDFGD